MNYTSEIFNRVNLQHIREFLLHGTECLKVSDKSYEERIAVSHDKAIKRIETGFPDVKECEDVMSEVYGYATTIEEVYMEIGMQCGVVLAIQFLGRTKMN